MSFDAGLFLTRATSGLLDSPLRFYPRRAFRATVALIATYALLRWFQTSRRQRVRTTQLRGPPSESFLYGVGRRILDAEDAGAVYEAWAREYGPVYAVPTTLGSEKIVLCDPKAVAHLQTKDTWTYLQTPLMMTSLEAFVRGEGLCDSAADSVAKLGRGLLWAHGENHKRQRKCLTPPFGIPAVRKLTWIFYDSAYKAKGAWDNLIESSDGDGALIEAQSWMNYISLDTIGLACFVHDFGALQGKLAPITKVIDEINASPTAVSLNKGLWLLGDVFPFLAWAPTSHARLRTKLNAVMEDILNVFLARTRKKLEMGLVAGDKRDQSIIESLLQSTNSDSEFRMTKDEIMSQMKVLFTAGYETTAISLSWALLELSRNLDVQTTLRNELVAHGADPTYDELANGLAYLNAVVHEILRVHPPILEIPRVAAENDVIPLSQPIRTKSGDLVGNLMITKGTRLTVSLECMNRSCAIWGDDAKVFRPSRWLTDAHGRDGIPARAKDVQGYRHLLTFSDGPRTCLGKTFAVTELKAVLTVLVKNFVFELRDGVDGEIEIGRGVLPRPKVAGEEGCKLPLRVRSYRAQVEG